MARARTGGRGTTSGTEGAGERRGRAPGSRRLLCLLTSLCVALFVTGCVTQSIRNNPMEDLLRQVGVPGKVLLYGTVSGDVNAFSITTSDGRSYEVSQIIKGPGRRLFCLLDAPRNFTITGISTEAGSTPFVLHTVLPVAWRGAVTDSWINSSSLYLGRIDIRLTRTPPGGVEATIDRSKESEDRLALQQALSVALSVPRKALPAAGQAPPAGH